MESEIPQDTTISVVNLDSLNKKEKAKEFKAAIKLVKSKEMEYKKVALEKFSDYRYLLEGGAIIPFLESIVPKKVWPIIVE
jgi:predicted hydrolase (HD superfamily)